MTTVLLIAAFLIGFGGIFYFIRDKAEKAPIVPTPLPASTRKQIAVFTAWNTSNFGEKALAKHGLMWHAPEYYGVYRVGRVGQVTTPSRTNQFDTSTLIAGMAMRERLRQHNPDMLLFAEVSYCEGRDAFTDFPPDHPFWKRVNGQRVRGWVGYPDCYLFDLDNPDVREHCALAAEASARTGIWDGLFLDVFSNDQNHIDILMRIRSKLPSFPIIVNCNTNICEGIAHWCHGILMECGSINSIQGWRQLEAVVDWNERHVRQPSMNCLEVPAADTDQRTLMNATCLALTSMNGFVLVARPGPNYATTHEHPWHPVWDIPLGRPRGSTIIEGGRRRRLFEGGEVIYDPVNGSSIV